MNIYSAPVKAFKTHARKILEEQTTEVQKHYNNKEGTRKSLRLKIFNEHLNILKEHLQSAMKDVITHSGVKTGKDNNDIEKKLAECYDEFINEFLKRDFDI